MKNYHHLGIYSDLVAQAGRQAELYPPLKPGPQAVALVRKVLGFEHLPEEPQDVQVERRWEKDGLEGEELSYWVGYGPRAHAWLLKPAGATRPLPGVLALHDHGGFKYYGKEKIAEGPEAPSQAQRNWWNSAYGGRAWANALAQRGFAVLVNDTFLWGSRKFPIETIESAVFLGVPQEAALRQSHGGLDEIAWYNLWAGHHEHVVAKYCNLLGTCLAGVVAYEDRLALNLLRGRADVQAENLACLGLSGGGNRSCLLRASASGLKAAGVVGLMSTYAGLLDHNVAGHTWMFFPSGWAREGDWPDLAACQAPAPLLVQYDREDELFTPQGMQAAHERLSTIYAEAGQPQAYCGQFYPGPHKFDQDMQAAAFAWLEQVLAG